MEEIEQKDPSKLQLATEWADGLFSPRVKGEFNGELSSGRLLLVSLALFFLALVVLWRTLDLQIIHGRENYLLSEQNRVILAYLQPRRGLIFDRQAKVLARNKPSYSATLTTSQIPAAKKESLIIKIAQALDLPVETVEAKYTQAEQLPFTRIELKNGLTHEQQLQLAPLAQEIPGLALEEGVIREYPYKDDLSHVLGYVSLINAQELATPEYLSYDLNSRVGREGLERVYEHYLRGKPGRKLIEVNALGEIQRESVEEASQGGDNLFLTLDIDFQKKARQILEPALKKYGATGGVFIAQEVSTGKILSLVSLPAYDNNLLVGDISASSYQALAQDESQPLFNRATAGQYPPGSTIKPVMAVAALQEGIITEDTRISDQPQVIRIGPWEFPDWTVSWGRGAHGNLNLRQALAESCDTFFYKVGGGYEGMLGLGVEKIKVYFNLFGLGSRTGIDLLGEASGLVPDPIFKQESIQEGWFLGDTYHLSIGQGYLLATPLQIVNMINVIANQGRRVRPYLTDYIQDSEGKTIWQNQPSAQTLEFIDPRNLAEVQAGLRLAVTDGIIYPLRQAKVSVAAKTGTAEFGVLNAKGEYQTHAWVTGYAPFDDPQISFVVLLEAGGKSNNAAEVAREILDLYFDKGAE